MLWELMVAILLLGVVSVLLPRLFGSSMRVFSDAPAARHKLLVTLHRRETQGDVMREMARTIARLAELNQIDVLFPVHRNPAVRDAVRPLRERKRRPPANAAARER